MNNEELMKVPLAQQEALNLYHEMCSQKLEVKLDGEPGQQNRARVVENRNPEWYRMIFAAHYGGARRGKKARPGIKRVRVLARLKNLSEGVYKDTFLYNLLVDEIRSRLYDGYYIEEHGIHVPPQMEKFPWEDDD